MSLFSADTRRRGRNRINPRKVRAQTHSKGANQWTKRRHKQGTKLIFIIFYSLPYILLSHCAAPEAPLITGKGGRDGGHKEGTKGVALHCLGKCSYACLTSHAAVREHRLNRRSLRQHFCICKYTPPKGGGGCGAKGGISRGVWVFKLSITKGGDGGGGWAELSWACRCCRWSKVFGM